MSREDGLAWHWTRDDCLTSTYDGSLPATKIEPGVTLTHDGDLIPCQSGLHFSWRAIDALRYAPGSYCWRVAVSDERVEQDDKGVARTRTALWGGNARTVMDRWLCACLERMIAVADEYKHPVGAAEREAITVQRRWLAGDATIEELISARAWASARAWDSARARAWDSAWASAWDSASASAWDSASASAWDSAWASAWDSAWDSAWASAWDSASASELEWQNTELERLLTEAFAPTEAAVSS